MHLKNTPLPIYLDQNVLSHLREGKSAREVLSRLLGKLGEKNVVFVYSMTHVHECRDSAQPETFVQVMEDLPVYFMEFQDASEQQATLSLGRARELLLEAEDATHQAARVMEGLLKVMHFARGWLGDADVQAITDEMTTEMEELWETLLHDLEWDLIEAEVAEQAKCAFVAAQSEMALIIKDLPFEQARAESKLGWAALNAGLPASFAQLDEVPDERAVSFVFSCFDGRDRELIENQFPQGFWKEPAMRETGHLAGLAFMLFLCGLVRDRRVKKGANEKRVQHFRGQFRDGVHIENAAKCAAFITCDEGAARLARSLYAYAGVETKVIELTITESVAQTHHPTCSAPTDPI